MSLADHIPRKTITVSMRETAPLSFARGPGSSIVGVATTPEYSDFRIILDGEDVMHVPQIAPTTINGELIPVLLDRLKLLEDILRSCDVNGSALVVRDIGRYDIVPAGTYTIMSDDPEDRG